MFRVIGTFAGAPKRFLSKAKRLVANDEFKMKSTSYWLETGRIGSFPALNKDISVDILIIGGGITGITTAYLLKQSGFTVALIERERLAAMDTGHTTAHLTYVTDTSLDTLEKNFGANHAEAVWDAGAAAIDEVEAIVAREAIDCEFNRLPGYLHTPVEGPSKAEKLKEIAQLAQRLGFDATFLESIPLFGVSGVRFANQAKFHPRKYLAKLIDLTSQGGLQVFEKTAAAEFDAEKRRVKANGHWIAFDRVAILTNNPLVGLASMTAATLFQTKLSLYSSYVLGARVPSGSLPVALFWDLKEPYDYLRVDPQADFDYIIFGGEDQKTGQGTPPETCYDRGLAKVKKIIPAAKIEHRWSGQVIETNDGLPFIGENAERQFIATGFCGNGITLGTIAAMMARDWATGIKNPWSDLFAPDRKVVRGGVWDYLRENKDYPYYLIKGRLERAEADSVRELKPDSGMIVKSSKGKVAAYRDSAGKVHKHSAVCTHMGCIVRWNEAEKTWDCPCHGSRFKPTGEVIAGPAETPLSAM
ncbi:MAG: FAD-dependent oxidoreductase [Verrucomicrobia bacterium]|nr:MAG: FAD-dependent oxidoreductase [Verrucomicrobiota bacterium]